MPVTESAKKALRNAQAKQVRNTVVKAELKRALKNATLENVSDVVSMVDKAAKRGLIHKNKAARIKSSLSKMTPEMSTARMQKDATKPAKKAAKNQSAVKAKATKAKKSAAKATKAKA